MSLSSDTHSELSQRLARLIADAKASDLALTIAALDFAAFLLEEDLRRRVDKP
jgi:hypothetical protein